MMTTKANRLVLSALVCSLAALPAAPLASAQPDAVTVNGVSVPEHAVPTEHTFFPRKTYVGVNRDIVVDVSLEQIRRASDADNADTASLSFELIVAGTEVDASGDPTDEPEILATFDLPGREAGSELFEMNVSEAFPVIWSRRGQASAEALYLQPVLGGERTGAPLIIEPQAGPGPGGVLVSGVRLWERRDIVFETELGEMTLRLRPDIAPETAYRILELAEGGWYDGVTFHRIVAGNTLAQSFVIQGGDPTGTGAGGPGFRIDREIDLGLLHDYGVVSMARSQDPNSAGSQFFICLSRERTASLDRQYATFGELVEGAETVAAIASVPKEGQTPLEPPVIERAYAVPSPPVGTRSRIEPVEMGAATPVER